MSSMRRTGSTKRYCGATDSTGNHRIHHARRNFWVLCKRMLLPAGFADARKKLFTLMMLLCCLTGCAGPQRILVVVVGGLGFSQLDDLRKSLEHQCPQATVVSAGAWNGYKTDVEAMATAKPHEQIIFIGHSFGCQTIAQAAAHLAKVDLAVFIDPAWDDFRLVGNIAHYRWYQRSGKDIEREAHIVGADKPEIIKGDHNSIPHSPELIAEVVAAINELQSPQDVQAVADPREPGQ
jgi:pimeloyl-ACP methyl ester carboxylesterase